MIDGSVHDGGMALALANNSALGARICTCTVKGMFVMVHGCMGYARHMLWLCDQLWMCCSCVQEPVKAVVTMLAAVRPCMVPFVLVHARVHTRSGCAAVSIEHSVAVHCNGAVGCAMQCLASCGDVDAVAQLQQQAAATAWQPTSGSCKARIHAPSQLTELDMSTNLILTSYSTLAITHPLIHGRQHQRLVVPSTTARMAMIMPSKSLCRSCTCDQCQKRTAELGSTWGACTDKDHHKDT